MKTVVNNCLTHYIDIGISTAVPVVFIHGFPFSHKMWTFSGGQTESIATQNRIIAYDVRGHGDSEVGDAQYSIEFFVDDFFGLLDHLNVSSAIVVGLSMGGYIALRAYERNPERFRALVLCDTKAEADSNDVKIRRSTTIKAIKQNGPRVFAQEFVANIFSAHSFNTKPDTIKFIQSVIERSSPASLCATLLALAARTDTSHILPTIAVPTLLLFGEHDGLTPPAVGKAMFDKIPSARLEIIPKAGHMANMENPEVFNQHFAEFVSGIK
jgi:pimeloyl-ACP methyl ester carboxylesterase